MKIIILAAGIGSRLGNPYPKPLTRLSNGKTIAEAQIENLISLFSSDQLCFVVGYKKDLIMEAFPEMLYVYNEKFDTTNTSKSLLKALKKFHKEDVLWINGDVVFDKALLNQLILHMQQQTSFVCVNRERVGEEEVKYLVDGAGNISEISKSVENGLGEAIGINFIASRDIDLLIKHLEACDDNDYFERGLELAVAEDGLKLLPLDISGFLCKEIDFQEDLDFVNKHLSK